jgi:hypothetical protein
MFKQLLFWARNQGNHQNFDPSLLLKKLTDFHRNGAKIFQNGKLKKLRFSKPQIFKNNSRKFQRLVLGLIGLIDVNGIDVAQPLWL